MSKEINSEIVSLWLEQTAAATASSSNVGDITNSANTAANFLGIDTADPGATGEDIYSDPKNLTTAVASILNRAQNAANFHPASQTPEQVAQCYKEYIRQLDKVPFMLLTSNDQVKQSYSSSNYDVLINNIVSLYEGVSQADKSQIKESITTLAKSVFAKSKSEVWSNLFSQSTLNYVSVFEIYFYVYYTTLHMRHEDKGKDGVSDFQEYTVNRAVYRVYPEKIHAYAKKLAILDTKNVDDWMDESTSPEKPDYKLCFEVTEYAEPQA